MISTQQPSSHWRVLIGIFIVIGIVGSILPAWCLYDIGYACPASIIVASTNQTTWYSGSITINRNQTVYFKGVDPVLGGHIYPMVDYDTENSVLKIQPPQSLQLQFDLNYIAGNGFNQTNTCYPLQSVNRSYSTSGTYYIYERVDDVGTICADDPTYADSVFTVYVNP
jgi:hypothetical protein